MSKIYTLLKLMLQLDFKTIASILIKAVPKVYFLDRKSANSIDIILNSYGHKTSFDFVYSLGNDKFPWMTYSFLDFIKNLDLKYKNVFEYGSGNSTIFWSNLAQTVVSVENNKTWYDKVSALLPENSKILYRPIESDFINSINENNKLYDIIILDGYGYRFECAKLAVNKLNKGGMIVLDDSDNIGYKNICQFLRDLNLIQIDFIGLKPMSDFLVSTSIFISRDFNSEYKYTEAQPKIFVGNQRNYNA